MMSFGVTRVFFFVAAVSLSNCVSGFLKFPEISFDDQQNLVVKEPVENPSYVVAPKIQKERKIELLNPPQQHFLPVEISPKSHKKGKIDFKRKIRNTSSSVELQNWDRLLVLSRNSINSAPNNSQNDHISQSDHLKRFMENFNKALFGEIISLKEKKSREQRKLLLDDLSKNTLETNSGADPTEITPNLHKKKFRQNLRKALLGRKDSLENLIKKNLPTPDPHTSEMIKKFKSKLRDSLKEAKEYNLYIFSDLEEAEFAQLLKLN